MEIHGKIVFHISKLSLQFNDPIFGNVEGVGYLKEILDI
jgi:hypothetical protein